MPLLTRKKQFALKVESVEGTAETLAAADVVMEVEETEANYTPEMQERDPLRKHLSPKGSVVGIEMGEATGRTETAPGATTTTKPNVDRLLLACGLQVHTARSFLLAGAPAGTFLPGERITGDAVGDGFFVRLDTLTVTYVEIVAFAATEVVTGSISAATATTDATPALADVGFGYRPNSVNPDSFTAAVMADGIRKQVFGARAEASLEVGGTGQVGFWAFTMSGAMTSPVDSVLFAGVTVPDDVPETFKNAAVKTDDATELCVDTFNLALGNTVARRSCSNAATGVKSYRITNRRPVISIDPEAELEATINFFGKFAGGTLFSFYAQIGSTAGKRTIVCAPRVQYQEMPGGDREGIMIYSPTLLCTKGGHPDGDDEVLIVFA
ncbi:MAG: hypothetical protein V3U03_17535 [Myxococcota bacterium]